MTNKERIHNALEGKTVDRMSVTVLYNQLYYQDHFAELTGKEQWELHKWLNSDPDEHVAIYKEMISKTPFEILQPQGAPSRYSREDIEFVIKDGKPYIYDKREDRYTPVVTETVSGHPVDYQANQTQYVYSIDDVKEQFRLHKAEDMLAGGSNDYLDAVITKLGSDNFILSGN